METPDMKPAPAILTAMKIAVVLVFALSYRQWPLYTSNQNTYFVHALAQNGMNGLKSDWLAQTADPAPVFTMLAGALARFPGEQSYYFLAMILLAVFVYALLGILDHVFRIEESPLKFLAVSLAIVLLYSGGLRTLISKLPLIGGISTVLQPEGVLTWGVAGQYLLGPIFQPSMFGVFLLLSLFLFLRGNALVAAASAALAATFHPTYLVSAAMLVGTFMIVFVISEKDLRKAALTGLVALVCILPILLYSYLHFAPTSAVLARQAEHILVDVRIPHHAKLSAWLGAHALFQAGLILIAAYIVRRTRLAAALLLLLLAAAALTAAQAITGSNSLALLFPWRIGALLVPAASSVVLAALVLGIVTFVGGRAHGIRAYIGAALAGLLLLNGYWGIRETIALLAAPRTGATGAAMFAAKAFRPGDLYLVPPGLESFRLGAGVPVFVDLKSNPYKDTEVIEWYKRYALANGVYTTGGDTACSILAQLSSEYPVTHIIVAAKSPLDRCGGLREVYRDTTCTIYELGERDTSGGQWHPALPGLAAVVRGCIPSRTAPRENEARTMYITKQSNTGPGGKEGLVHFPGSPGKQESMHLHQVTTRAMQFNTLTKSAL